MTIDTAYLIPVIGDLIFVFIASFSYPMKNILSVLCNLICGFVKISTFEPSYLELAYFELPLISKWKSGPCFNMKLWQQVIK